MNKDFFEFKSFDELQVGDVFKFCNVIDSDVPNVFFTVFRKDEVNTNFNTTYGKHYTQKFSNNTSKEIMIFPNRKK